MNSNPSSPLFSNAYDPNTNITNSSFRSTSELSASLLEDPLFNPKWEETFLFRAPPNVADRIRRMIKNGNFNTLEFKWVDSRNGFLHIDDKKYYMKLLDLPCVLEIQKTTDKTTFYKSGDIGQMIHISEQETIDSKLLDGEYRLASGLTPPTFEINLSEIENEIIRLSRGGLPEGEELEFVDPESVAHITGDYYEETVRVVAHNANNNSNNNISSPSNISPPLSPKKETKTTIKINLSAAKAAEKTPPTDSKKKKKETPKKTSPPPKRVKLSNSPAATLTTPISLKSSQESINNNNANILSPENKLQSSNVNLPSPMTPTSNLTNPSLPVPAVIKTPVQSAQTIRSASQPVLSAVPPSLRAPSASNLSSSSGTVQNKAGEASPQIQSPIPQSPNIKSPTGDISSPTEDKESNVRETVTKDIQVLQSKIDERKQQLSSTTLNMILKGRIQQEVAKLEMQLKAKQDYLAQLN